MKKIILVLCFALGSILNAEPTEKQKDSFLTPEAQVYISKEKEWFFGYNPSDTDDTDPGEWKKFNFLIHVVKVGNKYRVAYSNFGTPDSYDKEGYPILKYKNEKVYDHKISGKRNMLILNCCEIDSSYVYEDLVTGTEIKNGKKYERKEYQLLSENELNMLLKSKGVKRLDPVTEKNVKRNIKDFREWFPGNAG